MKFKLALLAAAGSLAISSAAFAGDGGIYTALGAGYTWSNDENDFQDDGSAVPASFDTHYDLDETMNVYAAIGKYMHQNYRGELEFATRTQNIDELPGDGLGFGGFASDGNLGDLSVTTYMINGYRDFDLNIAERVDPYIGAGIGFARARFDFQNLTEVGTAAAVPGDPYRVVVQDKDWALAYQAMAGLVFDLADDIDVDVRYRYLTTGEFDYGGFVNNIFTELDSEYSASELTAGFRWNFGVPAPVAAPAPAPAPVQYKDCWDGSRVVVTAQCPPELPDPVEAPNDIELTVYFDLDKSNLTPQAQNLIRTKAMEALEFNTTAVSVEGHTDTSGSSAYNAALSNRRASVVTNALISNGISAGIINATGLGESQPAKATGDGVREPLNRRTEVTFDF